MISPAPPAALAETVEPYFRETVEGDRHRLAQIEGVGRWFRLEDQLRRIVPACIRQVDPPLIETIVPLSMETS